RETGALTKGRLFPEADTLPALSAEEFDLQKEEPVRDRQEGSLEHETDAEATDLLNGAWDGSYDDPDDDEREIPDIMELLTAKENHLLSVNGFMGLDSLCAEDFSDKRRSSDRRFERARVAEERFYEVYTSFAEQEQKNRSAKKAKEYLFRFRDMREKLDADDSISGEEKESRLYGFIKDISKDIEIFRELYVKKLGGGKRKERILEFLERYDELLEHKLS
ncbi:MAG: hypothetical protein K5770_16995, partial [Lachnospiraceae bacterium]|nr:hypothetical protein [Lachnospiraceae bacterium]